MSLAAVRWSAFTVLGSIAAFACGDGDGNGNEAVSPDAGVETDAGAGVTPEASAEAAVDSAPPRVKITVTTSAPTSTVALGGKSSATWAAQRDGEGAWSVLVPTAEGTYELTTAEARWSMAFACDDLTNDSSTVAVYRRPSTTTALDVTLDTECARAPASAHAITGSITKVPAATSWLSFGYALSSRGSVVGVAGTTASYEVINVVDGTWDLMYGLRDDGGSPLTRVAIRRGQAIAADITLDFDMTALGVTPIAKAFVVRGVAAGENLFPTMTLVAAGATGLDVGPQNVPTTLPEVHTAYDSVPAASLVKTDRYLVDVQATSDPTSIRRAIGSFHDAADVDVTLPVAMAAPVVAVSTTTPYLRLSTRLTARSNTATYEVAAEANLSKRSRRRWSASIEASVPSADVEYVMPDLSAVAGFKTTWVLPSAVALTVTGAAKEPGTTLSDGKIERIAQKSLTFTP